MANKEKTIEERMLEFQERQLAIQEGQLKVQQDQLKQTESKSKKSPALVSAFNPQGQKDYPMPALKCEVFMPFSQAPGTHGFDYEEVELINRIQPGEYRIEMKDESILTVTVVGPINGTTGKVESLRFAGPWDPEAKMFAPLYTRDNKEQFPGIKSMCRQILRGSPGIAEAVAEGAPEILTIKERTRRTTLPESDPKHLPVSVSA
jgi:hypothetical protein